MYNMNNKSYIISLISFIIIIVSIMYFSIFMPIYNYDSNRIYNLRIVPKIYRSSLLEKFIDITYKKDSILVLGDSQPNGFGYPDKYIFSTLLENKLNKNIINASFQDARIIDNIFTLNYVKKRKMKFNSIIFNVNEAHIRTPLFQRLDTEFNIDYKIGILKNRNQFQKFSTNFNITKFPKKENFHKRNYKANYFEMSKNNLDIYYNKLVHLMKIAKSISNNVIIYVTSHPEEEIKRLDYNMTELNMFYREIKNICIQNNVVYIEPKIIENHYFRDIVHFNSKGHEKMSKILYNIMKNEKK